MDGLTDLAGALAVNQFTNAWLAAMNDSSSKPEQQIDEELRQWLRDNVTEEDFCNGHT
jgi:hypothetical protein